MRTQLNLMNLARRQRWMIWLLLTMLIAQATPALVFWATPVGGGSGSPDLRAALFLAVGVFRFLVYALSIVGVVRMLISEGNNIIMIVLCGLLMVAPCANLLLLFLVNTSATRTLRRAGIRVGFMGASLDEVERIVDPNLCSHCGYNLTGNVSGICPECGTAVPPSEVTTAPAVPPTAPTT